MKERWKIVCNTPHGRWDMTITVPERPTQRQLEAAAMATIDARWVSPYACRPEYAVRTSKRYGRERIDLNPAPPAARGYWHHCVLHGDEEKQS